MVVSGLPQRNGERHSAEIANLALNLRRIISGTSVPHIPDHKLQLRIGVNTGMRGDLNLSYIYISIYIYIYIYRGNIYIYIYIYKV